MSFTVLTNPNPQLRERSVDVDAARITTPEFQKFADDFSAFMMEKDGAGFAAPQIGRKERIIVINEGKRVGVYVNPEIIKTSPAMAESEEGCFSVPGVFGVVDRHKRVTIQALDRHGRRVTLQCSGLQAFIFQHEIDHLNGILFIDKVKRITHGSL
jgi:peptide deformylase